MRGIDVSKISGQSFARELGDIRPPDHLATADGQETAELWTRINSEAAQLRRRNTPIHVQSKILNSLTDLPALPDAPPDTGFKLTTTTAVLGGLLVLAIGAALGFMLVR